MAAFDGVKQVDKVLDALQQAGFPSDRASARVIAARDPNNATEETSDDLAFGLGTIIGALVGGIIGQHLRAGAPLALVTGVLIGIAAGLLVAHAVTRRRRCSIAVVLRPGTVLLTLCVSDDHEAQNACALFARCGGTIYPTEGARRGTPQDLS